MKKLFLLVGLVVFLTPMVGAYESSYKKCKIKNGKIEHSQFFSRCYAKIKLSDGGKYDGEFNNGYFEGRGTYEYPNGDVYEGYWNSGKYHGEGILTLANGEKKIGEWTLGVFEGEEVISKNFYCKRSSGKVYKSKLGCSKNIEITEEEFLNASKKFYCKKFNNELYVSSKCNGGDEIISQKTFAKLKKEKEIERDNVNKNSRLELISKCQNQYPEFANLSPISQNRRIDRITGNCGINFIVTSKSRICQLGKYREEYRHICSENVIQNKKDAVFKELALSLGCGSKSKDINKCVQRWLPTIIQTGPIDLEEIEELKKDKELMGEIVFTINEIEREKNQNENQEPTEEEKQQALAQQNATGQATWKYTSTGIGYFDFGNGFGWAPPNPKRDKIISGLLVSQRTKNKLMIGSRGRTIFIPR